MDHRGYMELTTQITAQLAAATGSEPAGGAALGEVVLATGGAALATTALMIVAWAHRTGRTQLLARLADFASRSSGLASWAALPAIVATVSLLIAVLGMYWDISLHIDEGRDAGPLANPAHYFILFGLYGIWMAGMLACVLPQGGERPGRAAVKVMGDWYAPVGGIVLLACSSFALIGFPLDDLWHRAFGQDVTLWGPTHLMLIGGAGISLLGVGALTVEGATEGERPTASRPDGLLARFGELFSRYRAGAACGGLLIGLSTFQAEFDFGVPQFRFIFEPLMIAFAAGFALVTARMYAGPGGALFAAGFFIVVRGALALIVGPLLGETTPHFPLYIAEAACVEIAALLIATRRAYSFGALAGVLAGTVGFAAEYGWSHLWMPIAWPESLVGEALALTAVIGLAAGLLGAFVGSAFTVPLKGARYAGALPAVAGLLVIVAVIGYGLRTSPDEGVRANVALREVSPPPNREVEADIRIDPPSAAADADWVNITAWQGGGLVIDDLRRTGPGSFETTKPIPVHGEWKAILRVHKRDSINGAPIFMPRDEAIPAPEVPAAASFTRTFVDDKEVLQREQKDDVAAALPLVAYGVVGTIVFGLVMLLGWALDRLGRRYGRPPSGTEASATERSPAVPAAS